MKNTIFYIICFLAGLIIVLPAMIAQDKVIAQDNLNASPTILDAEKILALNDTQVSAQNEAQDDANTLKSLRVGFEKIKPLNNLDVYSSRAMHELGARSTVSSSFNISQRRGNISNFTANTNIYKPFFEVNRYTRAKPAYEAPGYLGVRPVYNITGYPVIKTSSGIP